MIESIWQDLRHGTRMLVKNPGFTFVAMISIAIGVGANAAMLSLADGLVSRPLQVPRAGDVVAVSAIAPRANENFIRNRLLSYPDYVDLRDRAQSFSVALALMLLTVTVFLHRAFQAQLRQPGFRTERILLANFEPRLARYDAAQTAAFYTLLKEQARALPGVTSVGMTSVMPLNQDYRDPVTIVPEGFQLPRGADNLIVLSSRIDESYFDAMSIAVVAGRGIQSGDTANTPRIVVVNQAMATRYWPGQDAIGKRIRLVGREGQPWAEVVGVAANNKYNWIGEPPTPWLYLAQRQDLGSRSTLLLASSGDAAALASSLRSIVQEIDPNMPITSVRTMEEFYYGNATGVVTTLTAVSGAMGVMGLLAVVGLYGLVAYAVARRTREIGIRMAVGAQSSSVVRMVLRHGLALSATGVVLGVLGSIGVGGLLRGVFPSAGAIDLVTYLLVVPILVAVALFAAWIPARRAARIDPLAALRQE
jgi:predicted permease